MENNLTYYQKNKAKLLAYQNKYNNENRIVRIAYQKKYREKNKDKYLDYQARYRKGIHKRKIIRDDPKFLNTLAYLILTDIDFEMNDEAVEHLAERIN